MDDIIRRTSENLDSSVASSSLYEDMETKKWGEWTFLRTECQNLDIEQFYRRYVQRLEMSTLSLFLVIHLVIGLAHIIFLVTTPRGDGTPDVYAYVISILCIFLIQIPIFKTKKFPLLTFSMSYITVVIILLTDIAVPIYHNLNTENAATLRPAYSIYVILSIYIFLPITYNYLTVLLGFLTSVCYLVMLTMITYHHDDNIVIKVISDAIVFAVINVIGIYYRFMNEIVIRRTFLDRREYVQSSIQLKKERDQEKDLLLSILPEHTAHKLENDIKEVILKIRQKNKRKSDMNGVETLSPRDQRFSVLHMSNLGGAISKTYTEEHKNVSVLYADVVNYTMITTTLPVEKLVEILHELFVKFDEASYNNNVLRIKFLGDCYYAVAGVSQKNEQHARSCVQLGLQMIRDIRDVRHNRSIDIDMRIGVHTGDIIAGVIGACKWQYDIWSKDVDIASRMESTGVPGKVHVSRQTLDQLNDEYDYEEGTLKARNDPILQSNNIETFLISPYEGIDAIVEDPRRLSIGLQELMRRGAKRRSKIPDTKNFMQNSMTKFKELITLTNTEMERESERMPVGRLRFNKLCSKKRLHSAEEILQQKKLTKVSPLFLMFNNGSLWMEFEYLKQSDVLLKYHVTLGFVVLLAIITLQIINQLTNNIFWIIISVSVAINLFLVPIVWFKKIWMMKRTDEESASHMFINPKSRLLNYLYEISTVFTENTSMRYIVYLLIGLSLAASSIAYLVTETTAHEIKTIKNTWAMTNCILMTLCVVFVFTKVHFVFKIVTGLLVTGIYGWIIFVPKDHIYYNDKTINAVLDSNVAQFITLTSVILLLHLFDRQMEFIARVDFNASLQLMQQRSEAEVTRISNTILLQNILPAHVAEIYVDDNYREEFYHEKYEDVSVMFAQIMNFQSNSDENSLNILNQIICDFDEILLSQNSNLRLEKIKIAGWTYMVACGLDPARNVSSVSVDKRISNLNGGRRPSYRRGTSEHNIRQSTNNRSTTFSRFSQNVSCVMAQFALDLMKKLQTCNEHFFKEYDPGVLRVGISSGQVVAGVIGSNKPLYDIWGNTVNMASRMESTGTPGRIQVTKETAETLKRFDIACEYRGKIPIRGKSELVDTYYALFDENYEFIRISQLIADGQYSQETSLDV